MPIVAQAQEKQKQAYKYSFWEKTGYNKDTLMINVS